MVQYWSDPNHQKMSIHFLVDSTPYFKVNLKMRIPHKMLYWFSKTRNCHGVISPEAKERLEPHNQKENIVWWLGLCRATRREKLILRSWIHKNCVVQISITCMIGKLKKENSASDGRAGSKIVQSDQGRRQHKIIWELHRSIVERPKRSRRLQITFDPIWYRRLESQRP